MEEKAPGEFLTAPVATTTTPKSPTRHKLVLATLAMLALAVVFLLPHFVSGPWITGPSDSNTASNSDSPTNVSPSRAAEKTRFRQESQSLLAEIFSVRDRLMSQQVERWGAFEFHRAHELIDSGDQHYSYGDYEKSLGDYHQSLDILNTLEKSGQNLLQQTLESGLTAVADGDIKKAEESRALAAAIAPEDQKVKQLEQRVTTLPEVVRLLNQGDKQQRDGQLDEALASYQQAATLDAQHQKVIERVTELTGQIADQRFRQHMSAGYNALDGNNFESAKASFNAAGKIRPGDSAVNAALRQLENRRAQVSVDRQIAHARSLEDQEQWSEALAAYKSLLQTDPSLTEVKVKIIPAQVRAELDSRIQLYLDDPLRMSRPENYRDAEQVLADARGIANPGPRLSEQISTLDRLIQQSQHTVDVVFNSDSATSVTLFKVGRLGRFENKTVTLKPGHYIVAGERSGYRDVQVKFTVTGAPMDGPISVVCNEPI